MDPLMQLKDIQVPHNVSWWPPSPVWYLVLLLLAGAGIFFYRYMQKRKRLAVKFDTLKQIRSLEEAYLANGDSAVLLRDLSSLMRRYALYQYGQGSAALVGKDWLRFLDQTGGNGEFSKGYGKILANGPYLARPDYKVKPVLEVATRWVKNAGVMKNV